MIHFDRLNVPADELARLCSEFGVAELCAFGSVLRDNFTPESDVDLLVTFKVERAVSLFHMLRLQHALEDLIGRRVDLVPKTGLKPLIRDHMLATARRIYAA